MEGKNEKQIISYPQMDRSYPSISDRLKLAELSLVQLFVTGRSGAMLLHACIDSHPEVIQIPHTFKFYDFIESYPNILELQPKDIADLCTSFSTIKAIFNTEESVLSGGRLGDNLNVYVQIDKNKFSAAFIHCLPETGFNEKDIFYAIILCYAWCLDVNYKQAKTVLQHLHHGDWLWPEYLVEKYNLQPFIGEKSPRILAANKYLITTRHPSDACQSYQKFLKTCKLSNEEETKILEKFLRLLIQDWYRHLLVKQSKIDYKVVKLETLRENLKKCMEDVAYWMGVDTQESRLGEITLFGIPWYGDIYTVPTNKPNANTFKTMSIFNMDDLYVQACLGSLPKMYNYSVKAIFCYKFFRYFMAFLISIIPSKTVLKAGLKKGYYMAWQRSKFLVKILCNDNLHWDFNV